MKNYNVKNDTMNENDLQIIYNYPVHPRVLKITTDKGFKYIDNGSLGGTHWTCFYIKDNKTYFFDSLGRALDKFLLNQLLKLVIYHNYNKQDINCTFCEVYSL